jgi:hypothetical protein
MPIVSNALFRQIHPDVSLSVGKLIPLREATPRSGVHSYKPLCRHTRDHHGLGYSMPSPFKLGGLQMRCHRVLCRSRTYSSPSASSMLGTLPLRSRVLAVAPISIVRVRSFRGISTEPSLSEIIQRGLTPALLKHCSYGTLLADHSYGTDATLPCIPFHRDVPSDPLLLRTGDN